MQHAEAKKEIDSNIISDEQQLLQSEDKATKGFPKQYSKETVFLYKASAKTTSVINLICMTLSIKMLRK